MLQSSPDYFNEPPLSDPQPKNAFTQLMSSDGTPIRMTRKMPLYLQHAGHSRTIVGFEVDSQGNSNLLIFDPAKCVPSRTCLYALHPHTLDSMNLEGRI